MGLWCDYQSFGFLACVVHTLPQILPRAFSDNSDSSNTDFDHNVRRIFHIWISIVVVAVCLIILSVVIGIHCVRGRRNRWRAAQSSYYPYPTSTYYPAPPTFPPPAMNFRTAYRPTMSGPKLPPSYMSHKLYEMLNSGCRTFVRILTAKS